MIERKKTKKIRVGNTFIGGGAPISVQTMTTADPHDFEAVLTQARALQTAGADLIRLTVPDEESAAAFSVLKREGITVPLVADIHFDHKSAIAAAMCGADKIRINPGNIGDEWKVKEVASTCKILGLPIRIGVNSGSLERPLLEKYGEPTPEALAESALTQAEMLEKYSFSDIVISIKSSDISVMTAAARRVSETSDYPIHLGVTEAGDEYSGIIKSSVGIGSLLLDGIGDTIRVSLTADPVREVKAGREILKSLGLSDGGINIISCPTCGRTKIDIIGITKRFREIADTIDTKGVSVNVAIMGCVVNGPGEAKGADFGIAGGDGFAVMFKNGETVGRIEEADIVAALVRETEQYIDRASSR
ncbi:MAG: flavodoxin-dependent (E)-4-hydroxy-3-methylbut-2-enyl-diphosphate synthase [Clostridia bacterium]|nr:flavodoxin-dependent (E)-4-hydroxy-3-methylbut-2-enyl-diphosphate synthase [Clostridia bacterium]